MALSKCEITDEVINHIAKYSNITDLDLSACFSFSVNGLSCIGDMIQLRKLNINEFDLESMDGLSWIQNLTNLDMLNLQDVDGIGVSLDKDIHDICTSLVKLDYLKIEYTDITDDALASLNTMTSLRKLNLDKNYHLSDLSLMYISTLTSLTELSLCECTGITDYGIGLLNTVKSLQKLELEECPLLTDLSLKNIKLVSLKKLCLSLCLKISDVGLSYLKALVNLEWLDLFGIDITDSGLMHLDGLKLKWLSAKRNGLSEKGIVQFCDRTHMFIDSNLPPEWAGSVVILLAK